MPRLHLPGRRLSLLLEDELRRKLDAVERERDALQDQVIRLAQINTRTIEKLQMARIEVDQYTRLLLKAARLLTSGRPHQPESS